MRIAGRQRGKMYAWFMKKMSPGAEDTVLELGVTSDRSYDHSNYFVQWYPHKAKITACGIDDASFLEAEYPGVKFVQGDGCALPFADGEFDYVHSSAVLEHVGSRVNQQKFISEMWRVARKGIFLTTPNRWFPIEFHTQLPLVHWLPPKTFRNICIQRGLEFFSREENLNLLGRRELLALSRDAGADNARVKSLRLFGWPSNLMLSALRRY